jgi:hypothetical protein
MPYIVPYIVNLFKVFFAPSSKLLIGLPEDLTAIKKG